MRGQAGFSLFELLLVIVILSIVGAGFSKFFVESTNTYAWMSQQADLSPAVRLAVGRSLREISMIKDTSSVYAMTDRSLAFRNTAGDSIAFSWNGTAGGSLMFTKNESAFTLATNVDSLGFSYLNSLGGTAATAAQMRRVVMSLRLARGTHKVMNGSSVYVRNS